MAYEPQGTAEELGDRLGILSAHVQKSVTDFKEYIESRGVEDGAWRGLVHDSIANRTPGNDRSRD